MLALDSEMTPRDFVSVTSTMLTSHLPLFVALFGRHFLKWIDWMVNTDSTRFLSYMTGLCYDAPVDITDPLIKYFVKFGGESEPLTFPARVNHILILACEKLKPMQPHKYAFMSPEFLTTKTGRRNVENYPFCLVKTWKTWVNALDGAEDFDEFGKGFRDSIAATDTNTITTTTTTSTRLSPALDVPVLINPEFWPLVFSPMFPFIASTDFSSSTHSNLYKYRVLEWHVVKIVHRMMTDYITSVLQGVVNRPHIREGDDLEEWDRRIKDRLSEYSSLTFKDPPTNVNLDTNLVTPIHRVEINNPLPQTLKTRTNPPITKMGGTLGADDGQRKDSAMDIPTPSDVKSQFEHLDNVNFAPVNSIPELEMDTTILKREKPEKTEDLESIREGVTPDFIRFDAKAPVTPTPTTPTPLQPSESPVDTTATTSPPTAPATQEGDPQSTTITTEPIIEVPKKRKRGRPKKSEVLARQLEREKEETRLAALNPSLSTPTSQQKQRFEATPSSAQPSLPSARRSVVKSLTSTTYPSAVKLSDQFELDFYGDFDGGAYGRRSKRATKV